MGIVAKIGLTGGPAGGKTSFASFSKEAFVNAGFRPVYLSEVATLFDSFGIGPATQVVSNLEYQYMVAKYQLSIEDIMLECLQYSPDNILLICDRTLLDGKSYCSIDEWNIVLERLHLSEFDIYGRYDIVLHFLTTASGTYQNYSTENNPARSEGIEEAIKRDKMTREAYHGMQMAKKVFLDNEVEFKEKQNRAVRAVLGFLNLAEPIFGRQEKILVRKIKKEKLQEYYPKKIHISQTYLNPREGETERKVSCVTDNYAKSYYYTQKDENKRVCFERNNIKLEEYLSYLKDKKENSSAIEKDRWCFSHSNLYFQYDEFPFWENYGILEMQMTNLCNEILIPDGFEAIVNITKNTKLFNNSLAENLVTQEELEKMFDL